MLARWKERVRYLKQETYALYLAYRDPRVPWYARLLAALVVAHTLSPIDLIPDFIPILGYVDDLIITPIGLYLALRMIPPEVMADARLEAEQMMGERRLVSRAGLIIVVSIWLLGALLAISIALRWVHSKGFRWFAPSV